MRYLTIAEILEVAEGQVKTYISNRKNIYPLNKI